MYYYQEVYDEKTRYTYSCDMVRYNIELRKDCLDAVYSRFGSVARGDIHIYPVSFKEYAYRQLLTIKTQHGSVSLGIGFNGHGGADDRLRGFVEFNPNKVFPDWHKEFVDLCGWCSSVELKRVDLAVDIPVNRFACSLVKDGRNYGMEQRSAVEYTEYLGMRNKAGRVKLYNKQAEQKLSYPLTRLEITTEPDIMEFKKHLPEVVISDEAQIDLAHADMEDLSHNDKVTVSLLNTLPLGQRVEYLRKYTYRHRQKIEKYVLAENRAKINIGCVKQVFDEFTKYERLIA